MYLQPTGSLPPQPARGSGLLGSGSAPAFPCSSEVHVRHLRGKQAATEMEKSSDEVIHSRKQQG